MCWLRLLCVFNLVGFSILGAILIVCGLYTVVWGKSKDRNTTDMGKEASQELPMKDTTKSASDIFYGLEINVPGEVLKKGVPPTTSSWRSFHRTSTLNFLARLRSRKILCIVKIFTFLITAFIFILSFFFPFNFIPSLQKYNVNQIMK